VNKSEIYELVFNKSEDAIIIFALEGKILELNEEAGKILGYSREKLLTANIFDIHSQSPNKLIHEYLKKVVKLKQILSKEIRIPNDEQIIYIYLRTQIISYSDSDAILCFIRDISQRKKKEQKRDKLMKVIEYSSNAVAFADLAGVITYVNPRFIDMWGYSNINEIVGRSSIEFWKIKGDAINVIKSLRSFGNWTGNLTAKKQNGDIFEVEIYASMILDSQGNQSAMIGWFTEYTQKKKIQQNLKERKERFRLLFETMTQGVVFHKPDGRIFLANPSAERILGIDRDTMNGKNSDDPIWKTIHEDGSHYPAHQHPAQISIRTGKEIRNKIMGVYNPEKAEYRWININSIPLFKPGQKNAYQVYATFEDITEQKKAKDALKKSQEKLQGILNAITDPVAMIDKDYNILWGNHKLKQIFGNNIKQNKCFNVFYNTTEPCKACIKDQSLRDGQVHEDEKDVIIGENKKKRYFWCVSSVVERDSSGNPITAIEVGRDITPLKQIENRLRRSEKKYREMTELLPNAIFEMDKNLNLTYSNTAGLNMFGYTPKELENGLNGLDLISEKQRNKALSRVKNYLKGENLGPTELMMVKKDGTEFFVRINSQAIYKEGQIIGFRGSMTDIDSLIQTQKKLEFYKDLITHDIANILTNINIAIELFEYESKNIKIDSQIDDMIDLVNSQTQNGLNLLSNIQTVEEIEDKQLKPSKVNISEILRNIIQESPISKRLDSVINLKDNNSNIYAMAGSLVKHVFENLIINGINHNVSKKKYVNVEISQIKQGDSKYVKIDFIDNGLGVPDSLKQKIFQKQHQSDLPSKGMGIGLYLVREIIRSYNGVIEVKDNKPQGSIFTVILPSS
jgi:PAS domain S-box-containing protein